MVVEDKYIGLVLAVVSTLGIGRSSYIFSTSKAA
jgi:hypothetical protein